MSTVTMSETMARWDTVTIGECLRLINGRAFKPAEWSASGRPIIRIQNLNNPDAPFNYYEGDLPEKFAVSNGDLLFAWSGTPGTSFGAHIWQGNDAWLNQHIFKVLFSPEQFDKRFLRYAINQNLDEYIRAAHGGAGLAHITKGRFESSALPVPSLAEQRHIVAEIERQFTRLDAGIAGLNRAHANLKRYRAAVLKAACEGTLVPTEAALARAEGRDYETGEQLLERILTARRENWTGKGKYKQPAHAQIEHVRALPEGWVVASVDQLTTVITSGSRDWSKYYDKGSGTFIMAQNVRMGRLDLSERQVVGPPVDNRDRVRSQVRANDLLVTIVGANTGDVCRVPTELAEHYVCQSVALMRPVEPATAPFCEAYMVSDEHGQATFAKYIYGQGRPHLGFDELRTTPICIPPLAEQLRIVAEVERRLSVIDELEALVETNLARSGRLRQSILAKAFSGDLVPAETV